MPRLLTKRGCWITLAAAPFLLFLAAWGADKLWPLPLHEVNPARVVVAQDGTPLWRFADADGIWRYPVTIEDVSPRYLEALINYEDRWFWKHPGVNPFSVGARSMARSHFGTGYFRWQHAHYAGCSSA
ncbi:penicillin-binding protein 1C [Escherichia coli]|nr:penicillin-binding protein 1C [Escherichia coli]